LKDRGGGEGDEKGKLRRRRKKERKSKTKQNKGDEPLFEFDGGLKLFLLRSLFLVQKEIWGVEKIHDNWHRSRRLVILYLSLFY